MVVDASVARMRRDGRRWAMARQVLREAHSEGRDVKTTGGARASHGVLIWLDAPECRRLAVGMSPVKGSLAGLREAAGAERRPRRRLVMAPGVLGPQRLVLGWHGVQKSPGWGLSEAAHAKG